MNQSYLEARWQAQRHNHQGNAAYRWRVYDTWMASLGFHRLGFSVYSHYPYSDKPAISDHTETLPDPQ